MRNKGLINGKKDNDVSETTSCGSAGGSVGYVGYATPSAWGNGDLMKGKKSKIIRKPIWSGGKIIQENENLINDNEMIETSEQLQALLKTRKLTKNDIPKLKGQALYDVALKFANKMIGYVDWHIFSGFNFIEVETRREINLNSKKRDIVELLIKNY